MKLVFLILCVAIEIFATDKFDSYFLEAGHKYNVHPMLIKKIATIESSLNPKAICKNTNSTCDYGIMQINSMHLPRLRQYGINESNIMDPKINIYVGAWMLSTIITQKGFNLEAIGTYHSSTPKYKQVWLKKLSKEINSK